MPSERYEEYDDVPGPIVGLQKPAKKRRAAGAARKPRAAAKGRKPRARKGRKRRTRKQRFTYDDPAPTRGGQTRFQRDATKVAEKGVQSALAAAARVAGDPEAMAALKQLGRTRVSDVARAGKAGAGLLGAVALAGIASYALTTYLITRKPRKREEQLQAAFEASQALRAARANAALTQGEPLTPAQNVQLGKIFKKKLAALGVTNFSQKG